MKFSSDEDYVFWADEFGNVVQYDLESQSVVWEDMLASPGPRLPQEIDAGRVPGLFKRSVVAIEEVAPNETLLTAGRDLVVKLWDLPADSATASFELTTKLGPFPKFQFDSDVDALLWSIGADGMIRLIDIERDVEVSRRKAHWGLADRLPKSSVVEESEQSHNIAVAQDQVATVGGDRFIRLWRYDDGKIVKSRVGKIEHDHNLLSISLSADTNWVAAVDELAYLSVWNTNTGELVFRDDLNPNVSSRFGETSDRRPLTGKVGFNLDDSLLVAFGSGQTGVLYSTTPFQKLPSSIFLTGSGGTALSWSPIHREVVLFADNYPRYIAAAFNREQSHLDRVALPVQK